MYPLTSRLDKAGVGVLSAAMKMACVSFPHEVRVGASLHNVLIQFVHRRRTATNRQLNPIPYMAECYGHKLYVDQSEKLVMYGVTHVCAVDG
uniref:Uncharacterized protein n=1 Tax=Amphimedon queenslandica TaxID=400682 RepID=A0A1X7VMB6_AMPQE